MGFYYLSGLCLAFFSFSSLAADPPVSRGNVSVTLNPTTSYYSSTSSTFRIPHGVSVSPVTSSVPVVTKYPAGLQQTIPTGITIDAIKKSAPLPAVVRATTNSVKGAATRCLTSAKCNIGLILAGEGLSRLFDGLDWVMGEGGKVRLATADDITAPPLSKEELSFVKKESDLCYAGSNNPPSVWSAEVSRRCTNPVPVSKTTATNGYISGLVCEANFEGYDLMGFGSLAPGRPASCLYGTGNLFKPDEGRFLDDSEVSSGVESSYIPEPSDWPALTPELQLDDVEITSLPTLSSNPKTTTVYDADGNPVKVQETNTWYEFDVRDNPSSSPSLDLKTREQTKTYKDGVLTDTTTTESTSSGGAVVSKVDIPTDCDFMPTVCAFLDWFKDDNVPEDPDLAKIINDEDFERSYSIDFGDNSCPQPVSIDIAFLDKTIELSYEPACDLMGYARPFVLISAYIFAIYIGLGVVRNG